MSFLEEEFQTLKSMRPRDFLSQVAALGLVVCSALIAWEIMMLTLNTESPVVVVLSGSMEPGYYKGDLLLLNLWETPPLMVGDIIVYRIDGREVPIVHRVHRLYRREEDGELFILTKGDNNEMDDRALYPSGVDWISERDVLGRAVAYLPYVGYLTIWMTEYPYLRYVVVGLLGFFVLTGKDEQ